MSLFPYPDGWKAFATFKNATIFVVTLFLVTNAIWFALGRPPVPRQNIAWSPAFTRSPMFLLSDIAVVTVGLVVVYKLGVRSRYYRTAVVIYAMLLANLIGAVRSYLLLRIGL